jgi:hypothetical protein
MFSNLLSQICIFIFLHWYVRIQGPLSLVSTTEELLERKHSSSDLEKWEYNHRDPSRGILYPQKFALILLTSGGQSVSIVR